MNRQGIYQEVNRLWWLLRGTYAVAFIGSGLDKYVHVLVDWYAQGIPAFCCACGISQESMLCVRSIAEVLIGICLCTPMVRTSAYAAALWLVLSAVYVFMVPGHIDTGMRYTVIALGAYTLARLTVLKKEVELP